MASILYKIPVVRSLYKAYLFGRFRKAWRRDNRHNQTVPMNMFPVSCVQVGRRTYGELHIVSYYPEVERLIIGNYVSIAPGVRFILGGNHQTATLTTFPLKSVLQGKHCPEDAWSKGTVRVEDDVWIGYGAIILSGVCIGKGSIVGAGAVVSQNVPPYSVVAGNPARVVRTRLPEEVVHVISDLSMEDVERYALKESNLEKIYTRLKTSEEAMNLKNEILHERRQS